MWCVCVCVFVCVCVWEGDQTMKEKDHWEILDKTI